VKNKTDVSEFLAGLDHPLKAEIETVRAIILGSDPGITELVKWNAPSFFFKDDFATFNLRPMDAVQVIFHKGAKVRDNETTVADIADPSGLLRWLAKDRGVVTFTGMDDIRSKEAALADLVRQWIGHM